MTQLVLKRASASRSSGEWSEDDYDVLADGVVVGRIMKAAGKPADASWLWTLAYGQHEDRTPTHGYEATRKAAWRLSLRVGGENSRLGLDRAFTHRSRCGASTRRSRFISTRSPPRSPRRSSRR